MTTRVGHLARRWWTSLSRSPVAPADLEWVRSVLLDGEFELWTRMSLVDRRHSLVVTRRFLAAEPLVQRTEIAAALLHDVGKTVSELGTTARVIATLIGPRGQRFADYHRHEALGAELLSSCGSDARTIALVRGEGPYAPALAAADDV
ncbi:MAG: hypothetical protein ACKOA2_07370 [Ilumatobacteraceae bacterium]